MIPIISIVQELRNRDTAGDTVLQHFIPLLNQRRPPNSQISKKNCPSTIWHNTTR